MKKSLRLAGRRLLAQIQARRGRSNARQRLQRSDALRRGTGRRAAADRRLTGYELLCLGHGSAAGFIYAGGFGGGGASSGCRAGAASCRAGASR